MQNGNEEQRTWWAFYPLKGLDIEDPTDDLDAPLFGDATIVSRSQIRTVVSKLHLNERMAPGHDHESDVVYMLENATFSEEFNSFVAVRRTGVVEGGRSEELTKSAGARAFQIAGMLALVFLAKNDNAETCGLVEQLHRYRRTLTLLEFDDGGFVFQSGGGTSLTILDLQRCIRTKRSEIAALLKQKRFQGLASAVVPQRPKLPRSLRNAIRQAVVRLSDAVHSSTPSSRLLGAVTTLEILLNEQGDSFELTSRRVQGLLGTAAVDAFRADDVFRARHLYVHRGEEVTDEALGMHSIALALAALLRFAEVAEDFSHKAALASYLDLVEQIERVTVRDLDDGDLLSRVVRHQRSAPRLPFLRRRIEEFSQARVPRGGNGT